jgi:GT2 family glycosyltransferase
LFTEPVGVVALDVPPAGIPAASLRECIIAELGATLQSRLEPLGASITSIGAGELASARWLYGLPPFLLHRRAVLEGAPNCTVVVCTRQRPEGLRRTLQSLAAQSYPQFNVLVVDNDPNTDSGADVVHQFVSRLRIRRVVEPRRGLSRARNRGLREVETDLVAWLDDDALADEFWLAELARGFHDTPSAAAVSGVVVPASLDTQAQMWFEQFGGHSKGRGFSPVVFGGDSRAVEQNPLYPLPPFGVGTNMAFRTDRLTALGGFDEALGAGTTTGGGEDTKVFTQLLRNGQVTVYQPSALVRHTHRADLAGLRRQLESYGSGLTAFYTALLFDEPGVLWPLLKLAPHALRDLMRSGGLRTAGLQADFPTDLLTANRRGMLAGPGRYLREQWRGARAAGAAE